MGLEFRLFVTKSAMVSRSTTKDTVMTDKTLDASLEQSLMWEDRQRRSRGITTRSSSTAALAESCHRQDNEEPEPGIARKMEAHEVLNRIRKRLLAKQVIQATPTPAYPRSLDLPQRIRETISERFAAAGLDVILIPTPNSIVVQCRDGSGRYVIPHCTVWARMMDAVEETISAMLGGVDPEEQEPLDWNAYLDRLNGPAW
jgi:hypothetical protein